MHLFPGEDAGPDGGTGVRGDGDDRKVDLYSLMVNTPLVIEMVESTVLVLMGSKY
jgi:hypothetical protein